MQDIYIVGVSNEYIPSTSFFNVNLENITLKVENEIEEITKISCCANGNIEDISNTLNTFYAIAHINIEIIIHYMTSNNDINFHLYKLDKLIYINIGNSNNSKYLNLDTNILDLDIINIDKNKIDMYILIMGSID